MSRLDVVGIAEVAVMLDINRATVRSWQLRGHLPAPDAELASGPIWRRSTITKWVAGAGKQRVLMLQAV
jgi:hypothetical protein